MRGRLSIALIGLVALGAAACVPRRNAPSGGGATVTTTYKLGPLNLAAQGQPGWESQTTQGDIPRPSGAFGLKAASFDLVDENGDPVPRDMVHLHHVLLIDTARQDPLCSNRAEWFTGAGAERTPLSLPDPYAYLVGSGDHWNALWHVMNLGDMPMTVYIKYTLTYQPGANATNTRGVQPYFMDVAGCGNAEFNVPGNGGPGSMYEKSKTWAAPTDGVAVYAGGHLHGGGMNITLQDNGTGSSCTMDAHYSDMTMPMPGMMTPPESIDACPMHNAVVAGQTYTVTARYDNSMPLTGVMGIVLAYVWPGHQ
ncbi:MAG: hypothetical protein ACXV8Y_12345 [Acidimicrobiia bacterium]